MPNDGTVLGNVTGGGGVLQRKTFKYAFSIFFFRLSSFLSLSPSLSPSLSLSPSPLLFITLSSSLSFSLSYGFCLDRVLTGVKNGFR